MGAFYDEIPNEDIRKWILAQKIFWVGTAALSADGHVNLSPKGRPSFELVDNRTCWYLDMTGSGNETLSHIYEPGNGRITIMFVAFEGPPRIVRLFGKGKFYERGSAEFQKFLPDGDDRILPGTRGVVQVDIHKVATSCGFSVPFFDYAGERMVLDEHFTKHENSELDSDGMPTMLKDYWSLKNSRSIDSLPGLKQSDPSKSLPTPFNVTKEIDTSQLSKPADTITIRRTTFYRSLTALGVLCLLTAYYSSAQAAKTFADVVRS